jgi:hypothetical protein
MNNTQTCFKCNLEKPLSEFYEHPQMANGHLGKCKDCTKKDSRINSRTEKSKERERLRNTSQKRKTHLTENTRQWRKNNPEKYKAQIKLNNALRSGKIEKPNKCEECNQEKKLHAHHDDYSKPLDVIWLCVECHGKKNPNYIGINKIEIL